MSRRSSRALRNNNKFKWKVGDVQIKTSPIEFIRNKETGIVEAWENGEKIGVVETNGDLIDGEVESRG